MERLPVKTAAPRHRGRQRAVDKALLLIAGARQRENFHHGAGTVVMDAWRCMRKLCIGMKAHGKSQYNGPAVELCTRCWQPKTSTEMLSEPTFIKMYNEQMIVGQSPNDKGKGKGK